MDWGHIGHYLSHRGVAALECFWLRHGVVSRKGLSLSVVVSAFPRIWTITASVPWLRLLGIAQGSWKSPTLMPPVLKGVQLCKFRANQLFVDRHSLNDQHIYLQNWEEFWSKVTTDTTRPHFVRLLVAMGTCRPKWSHDLQQKWLSCPRRKHQLLFSPPLWWFLTI